MESGADAGQDGGGIPPLHCYCCRRYSVDFGSPDSSDMRCPSSLNNVNDFGPMAPRDSMATVVHLMQPGIGRRILFPEKCLLSIPSLPFFTQYSFKFRNILTYYSLPNFNAQKTDCTNRFHIILQEIQTWHS